MPREHPDFGKIRDAVETVSKFATNYSGVCYRCTESRFANEIIKGVGSQIYGGRWNPKGSFPTVYLCDTAEAALQEYLTRSRRMNLPDYKSMPMMMAWVRVKVERLLDVTDGRVLHILNPILRVEKTHWRTIQGHREAASQAMGRAAYQSGFRGLIADAQACKGARNIVIFPQNLKSSDHLRAPSLKPIRQK